MELSLCSISSDVNQPRRVICSRSFTFYEDAEQQETKPNGNTGKIELKPKVLVDLFQQCVLDMGSSLSLLYSNFPPFSSLEEIRELDSLFCDVFNDLDLPEGWSLVGSLGKEGTRMSTVNGM